MMIHEYTHNTHMHIYAFLPEHRKREKTLIWEGINGY